MIIMTYRNKWFDNNKSNHSWYTCVRCGKSFNLAKRGKV